MSDWESAASSAARVLEAARQIQQRVERREPLAEIRSDCENLRAFLVDVETLATYPDEEDDS